MSPPVSKPPTPSGHPIIGNTLGFARGPFEFVDRATSECGDLYRMVLPSVDVYVFAHPDYFRQALVADVDTFEKTEDFRRAFGNGLISTNGKQWSRQRNVLQPLFHPDRIKGYSKEMVATTQRRLETWESGEIRDMESEMQDLTLEILFTTLFGYKLQPGEGDDLRDASDGLNKWFEPSSWLLPNWIPTPSRREFKHSTDRLREEFQRLLSESNADSRAHTDSQPADLQQETLLSKLHEAREQDCLSMEEVEGQLLTMIFAGYETTASALGFAWYALATNPEIQQEFYDELDTVLDDNLPTYNDISELELTNRIITETLRLYPPVHTIPRETTQEVKVGEYHIPSGEQVHLSVIAVHRDERIYDNPLSFQPDRWTNGLKEHLHDFAYIPFGGGRRTCVGREFAQLEAVLALATIGQQWIPEWTSANSTITLEPEITTQTKNGLPMQLRQRS